MKLLLTADWHINDYPNYNREPFARLNAFLLLADRCIEVAQQHLRKH